MEKTGLYLLQLYKGKALIQLEEEILNLTYTELETLIDHFSGIGETDLAQMLFEYKGITTITTTADLWSHEMRIDHLNKLADHFKSNVVLMRTSAGTHRYIWKDGQWKPIVK